MVFVKNLISFLISFFMVFHRVLSATCSGGSIYTVGTGDTCSMDVIIEAVCGAASSVGTEGLNYNYCYGRLCAEATVSPGTAGYNCIGAMQQIFSQCMYNNGDCSTSYADGSWQYGQEYYYAYWNQDLGLVAETCCSVCDGTTSYVTEQCYGCYC